MHDETIAARLEAFEALCREKGLPVTLQRRVILEAVLRREDHPSADQIFDEVKDQIPQLSRTTIYRVLETLVDLGMIRRMHQSGAARFDGKTDRHHHLVCIECGKIIDLEAPCLDGLSVPECKLQNFEIEDFSVHFTGTCSDCRESR